MNHKLLYFILIIFSVYYFSSCANITQPTGGPRDTIAPTRLIAVPLDKTINYKGQTVSLEFDERIKTNKLKDQLIITPLIESEYETIIKKNIFKITFDEPFQDSTTYTLNFREAIQDITESNPTKDNKFTFSTGSFIDSMSINGYVKKLLTSDTLESIIVGLYVAEDTITIFNGSPYYFTEVEEDGSYLIENIKNGKYLLYGFRDDNKNLKLESAKEIYGFSKDTLVLDTGSYFRNLDLINLDLTEFKIQTALPSGQYFDVNLNKYISNYEIKPVNNQHTFYTTTAKENKTIRFYNNFENIDSLQVSFAAFDSINNIITDTIFVKFSTSKRKKDEFGYTILPENNSSIETSLDIDIQFNKPIILTNDDSIFVQFDTTKILDIQDTLFKWNEHKDKLTFSIEIDKSKADTIIARSLRLKQQQKDSVSKAQEEKPKLKQQASKDLKGEAPKINKGLQLYFGTGSFITADQDTSKATGYNYKFLIPEDHGIQEVNINTQFESFIVQLTSPKFEVIQEISNEKMMVFDNIKPGKYRIRVLIDADKDGKWSPGNMIKQIEPEPVYIYSEIIIVRADWRTSLNLTF